MEFELGKYTDIETLLNDREFWADDTDKAWDAWEYIKYYIYSKLAHNEELLGCEYRLIIEDGLLGSPVDFRLVDYNIYRNYGLMNEVYLSPYDNEFYSFSYPIGLHVDWRASFYERVRPIKIKTTAWKKK